jgi:hypothetical protein
LLLSKFEREQCYQQTHSTAKPSGNLMKAKEMIGEMCRQEKLTEKT